MIVEMTRVVLFVFICKYYATDFPVCVCSGDRVLYSLPEKIGSAAELTESPALRFLPSDTEEGVQYILSPAGERYIHYRLPEGVSVTLGPFLTESITDVFINDLIRSGLMKMRCKKALREYYDSLALISLQRYYYTGKLAETVLSEKPGIRTEAEPPDEVPKFIPQAYYKQAQTYRNRQFLHSPYIMEQEISHYISIGDEEGALRTLAEINARPRAQLAGSELRSLKNSMICSCAFMTRAAITGGVGADSAFTMSDAYIQQIEACGDIRSVLDFEKKMVAGFTAAVRGKKLGSYSPAVSRAIGFIEDHLCEDISLRQISEAVFLNPNYLSGLFNRETGIPLHRYIIRRRIEEASYFVRHSSEPLADIASFYRFSSQSHFVRCFREITGVTPGEYRKNGTDRR